MKINLLDDIAIHIVFFILNNCGVLIVFKFNGFASFKAFLVSLKLWGQYPICRARQRELSLRPYIE